MRVERNGIDNGKLATGTTQDTHLDPSGNLVAHSNSFLVKFCHFVPIIFNVISVKGAIVIKSLLGSSPFVVTQNVFSVLIEK